MKPRPLKELLQILLDEVERNGCYFGLFMKAYYLLGDKINGREYARLDIFLTDKLGHEDTFPKGEAGPRIEFLKNEIEKL